MHLFIRTTKVSEIIGLTNLTNLFGIPSFSSEFEFLRFDVMLKISAVVVGNRNIDLLHVFERTGSLLCLIFASILLAINMTNSFNFLMIFFNLLLPQKKTAEGFLQISSKKQQTSCSLPFGDALVKLRSVQISKVNCFENIESVIKVAIFLQVSMQKPIKTLVSFLIPHEPTN